MENASAMQGTLGTTVTALQTSARARARTARSAAAGGTVSVGSASAQSQEPLGRHARSARPAQMLAAPRGNGAHPQPLTPTPAPHLSTGLASSQAALRAGQPLPISALPALLGSETLTNMN